MGKKYDALKKLVFNKRVMGAAKKVNKISGGSALADYAGSKLAKRYTKKKDRKYVPDKTSGKDALKSAARVGWNISGIVGVGGIAKGISATARGAKAASKLPGKAVSALTKRRSLKSLLSKFKGKEKLGDRFKYKYIKRSKK